MAAQNPGPLSCRETNKCPRLAPRPASGINVTPQGDILTTGPAPQQQSSSSPRKKATKPAKWSPEQWEAKRDDIYRLYKVNGLTMEEVAGTMATLHNFEASTSMYKAKIAEWGEPFHKNKRQGIGSNNDATDLRPPGHAKRTRVAASLPKREKVESRMAVASFTSTGSVPKTLSPKQYKIYEAMLHAMGNSVKALFDKANMKQRWSWDDFGIVTLADAVDHSDTWKAISDQCHGASSLCQARCTQKALATIARLSQTLTQVVGEHGPWTFVYLWRIILSVRGISHRLTPSKHSFLGSFLVFFRRLVKQQLGDKHQLADFLSALIRVPFTETKNALEIVYQQAIKNFEVMGMGPTHPTVLAMKSHFLKYWKGTMLSAGVYAHYDDLVRRADMELEKGDTRILTLRAEYMYAAFYHGGDLDLTLNLALDLWKRTESAISANPHGGCPPPAWSRITYAYVLASKLLARVDRERRLCWPRRGWYVILKNVVLRLQGGDDECRTRAAQVQEMLAHWCQLDGYDETAVFERRLADDIRNTIPDAPANAVAWDGEWRLNWSARAHQDFLISKKKQKAIRKKKKKKFEVRPQDTPNTATGQPVARGNSDPASGYVCPADLVCD